MKKIIIAFAAIAAAFSLVSCNKEQIEAPSTDLKLNITVANLDGSADTKAVKTGWADGDKLNIWFDETNYSTPDLVLTYDGTDWNLGELNKTPNASGNMIVLYEGYNDWSKYTHNSSYMYTKTEAFAGAQNGYVYAQPIAYTNNGTIAYTYESNILSANLDSWESLTKIQVVVTGLESAKSSNYVLKEKSLYNGIAYFSSTSVTTSNKSYGGATMGVPNEEGIAFCFTGKFNNPSKWTFTLLDLSTFAEKTYTVSDKTMEIGTSTVTGIKIDYSKFE